jgi:nucleoside-diphosphate-sugar epimerase
LTKEGQSPIIYGDGEASRDFTYVANVVNANLLPAQPEMQLVKYSTQRDNHKPVSKEDNGYIWQQHKTDIQRPKTRRRQKFLRIHREGKALLGYSATISFDEGLIRVANS